MRARGGLNRCPRKRQPPSPAARAAIAQIERMLYRGCTPEELAQARAELQAARQPRQAPLPLSVKS